jgi:Rieske Fe-S protein
MTDERDDGPAPTRRELLGAAVGLVVVGCAGSAEKWDTKSVPVEDGIVDLDTSEYPQLVTPGGMLAIQPTSTRDTLLVMRLEGDAFRVLSMKCPHLGCTVRWDNEAQVLRCPCHGSRFDDRGRVTQGPAKSSLDEVPTRLQGTVLSIVVRE